MKFTTPRSILLFSFFLLCSLTTTSTNNSVVQAAETTPKGGLWKKLQQQYDDLPDQGKFLTGAVVGYATSRTAVKSATFVVKVAGAMFVATEALNAAGILEEEMEMTQGMQQRVLVYANDFRKTIRERLNPDSIRAFLKQDRMATMGTAAGAFVGFLR